MNLVDWQSNGWVRPHQTNAAEIAGLIAIVKRDLHDADTCELSNDWRFGIAYNAALKLCTILLHSSGFRAEKNLQHFRTIAAMAEVLGSQKAEAVEYLQGCRAKRNIVEYELAGVTTDSEAGQLLDFTRNLSVEVIAWLRAEHPSLLP